MVKETFEELVLKALKNLQSGQDELKTDMKQVKKDVRRVEVLHEETNGNIDRLVEVMKTQRDLLETKATKEDLYDNEMYDKLNRNIVKSHSVDIADLKKRVVRLEKAG